MDAFDKKAIELSTKGTKTRDEMIKSILERHEKNLDDPDALEGQLLSFWTLAYSLGSELGNYQGYKLAKDGKPLGQVAHTN